MLGILKPHVSTKPSLLVDIFFCETKKKWEKECHTPIDKSTKRAIFF